MSEAVTWLSVGGMERRTARQFTRIDPITNGVATRAAAASIDDALAAVEAASAAFPAWSALGPTERRRALSNAADALEGKAAAIITAMTSEIGSTEGWARFNISLASAMLREAASLTTQVDGQVIPSDKPGCLAMALREPVGVILSMAPWNAPVILATRALAVPLACGNTVVLKASELCPRTQALIVEALVESGLGGGIVNLVTNAPEDAAAVVGAMIDHPAVRRVNFTGSTGVGRIIARRCADNLKPALLELGGKAPAVVLEDADLDEAVAACALANDTDYGLAASVFTRDVARGLGVARRIRSGICHVNGPTVHDEAQMPFGGMKGSGYGKFGGRAGIDSFTELRWITIETEKGHFPI